MGEEIPDGMYDDHKDQMRWLYVNGKPLVWITAKKIYQGRCTGVYKWNKPWGHYPPLPEGN